ncbi:chaplin family protein [Haloglycomyces albus]|uniref:chaplin family protein n=1 Tax=Haloglycomyces albus TaxID=526067 RepID=UPI00046CD719|nr:chaplin family protein [Haloglycomyces albus]
MNSHWARKTVQTGAIAAGAVLVAGSSNVALADDSAAMTTHDQLGAVSGNQVAAPVQAPINICGLAVSVLGGSNAGCTGGSDASYTASGGQLDTHDNSGLLNGNQAYAPVQAPVDVCGVSASIAGTSGSSCEGGSEATLKETGSAQEESAAQEESGVHTSDNSGALSGNQLLAPVQAPIDVCGNAVAVGGSSAAGCEGGASATNTSPAAGELSTHDNSGLLNGNQAYAPIQAPINICGNAIAILGTATASCEGGSDAEITPPEEEEEKHHGKRESAGKA